MVVFAFRVSIVLPNIIFPICHPFKKTLINLWEVLDHVVEARDPQGEIGTVTALNLLTI